MNFCRIRCSRSSRDSVAGADTGVRFITSVAEPGQRNSTQQAAPDVAVGDDAEQAVCAIQHQCDLDAAALDRGNSLAHSCLRSNDGFAPGFHGYLPRSSPDA